MKPLNTDENKSLSMDESIFNEPNDADVDADGDDVKTTKINQVIFI